MSEAKLNYRQKLFALLETMVRNTKVHTVELRVKSKVSQLQPLLKTGAQELKFAVPAALHSMDCVIHTNVNALVEKLRGVVVRDASIEALNAVVADEPVDSVRRCRVRDVNPHFGGGAVDLFKEYNIKPDLKYHTRVHNVDLKASRARCFAMPFAIRSAVRDSLSFLYRFPVEQKSAVLSFFTEKEQLDYWRSVVLKTRKDPKKLQLQGIYTGIPTTCIDKLKINYALHQLIYYYKAAAVNFSKKGEPLRSIAIFTDLETGKAVKVVK